MRYLLILSLFCCMGFATPYAPPNDPILRQQAEAVPLKSIASDEIQDLIDKMLALSLDERQAGRMVGLAAPQIGVSKQIILVDTQISKEKLSMEHPLEVFINPQIVWQSEEKEELHEGCFSTGSLVGIVPRARKVRIIAYTREGEKIDQEFEGYTARIFQHEIDHLQGLRFPDRMTDFSKLLWVEMAEVEEYKKDPDNWTKKCSHEEWLRFIH